MRSAERLIVEEIVANMNRCGHSLGGTCQLIIKDASAAEFVLSQRSGESVKLSSGRHENPDTTIHIERIARPSTAFVEEAVEQHRPLIASAFIAPALLER